MQYQDRATGSYAAPSGDGITYHISRNGEWKTEALLQSSLYGCTISVIALESGTLTANGNQIVFDSRGGTLTAKDNCRTSGNYTKQLPPQQYSYAWRVERDEYGQRLCLGNPGQTDSCMYRK